MKSQILIAILIILVLPIIYGFSLPLTSTHDQLHISKNQISIEESLNKYSTKNTSKNITQCKTNLKLNQNKSNIFLENNFVFNNELLNIYTVNNYRLRVNNTTCLNNNALSKDTKLKNKSLKNNNYFSYKTDKIYTGDIEHLNFQTLMAFPEKALSPNNNFKTTFDEEKLTTIEFKNILNELYKNDYILVDIFEIIDTQNISKLTLNLPENKKPIILSFDNVTYKSNYQNLGEIDKIIIDRNNNIATYTTKKSIQDRIQYENEFVVILENFISKHPDFSHNNARGIIFLSGENGILGYNTNHKNTSSKYESKRACEVIKKLKSLGWRFGCNSYSYTDNNTKSDLDFAKEISLWNKEVRAIIGDTILYAHPYGIDSNNSTHQELLIANNFKIFFTNNDDCDIRLLGNICKMNRRSINGNSLRTEKEKLNHLFDCEKVYDHINRTTPFPTQ